MTFAKVLETEAFGQVVMYRQTMTQFAVRFWGAGEAVGFTINYHNQEVADSIWEGDPPVEAYCMQAVKIVMEKQGEREASESEQAAVGSVHSQQQ